MLDSDVVLEIVALEVCDGEADVVLLKLAEGEGVVATVEEVVVRLPAPTETDVPLLEGDCIEDAVVDSEVVVFAAVIEVDEAVLFNVVDEARDVVV